MTWTFSLPWFLAGIIAVILGVLLIRFHEKIADNLADGVRSYGKVKLFGLVAILLGLLFMTNLHTSLLYALLKFILPSVFTK